MKKHSELTKTELAMAQGYLEMAEINLEISESFFHLETEGELINEVVKEKGFNQSEAK